MKCILSSSSFAEGFNSSARYHHQPPRCLLAKQQVWCRLTVTLDIGSAFAAISGSGFSFSQSSSIFTFMEWVFIHWTSGVQFNRHICRPRIKSRTWPSHVWSFVTCLNLKCSSTECGPVLHPKFKLSIELHTRTTWPIIEVTEV